MLNFFLALGAIILGALAIIVGLFVICACRIIWAECSKIISERKND